MERTGNKDEMNKGINTETEDEIRRKKTSKWGRKERN